MWKSQFWLLANVANVQETTSLKGLVKMSRDHSLALAPSSTATCISLKTYIWPLGMIHSWAHSFELHFEQGVYVCLCVCARVSVSMRAPGSQGHLVSVTEIPERLICHIRLRWQPSGAFSRVCVCVHQTITAVSNPLMDRLTRNSTYLCGVCAFANNKNFKAEKSIDSAVALKTSMLSIWSAEFKSYRALSHAWSRF